MPDGTGSEIQSPTLADLNQLGWDLQYIRNKLTFNSTAKTFVWQKYDSGYVMTIGLINVTASDLMNGIRSVANRIFLGEDGFAPPPDNFGQTGWTSSQLQAMYNNLLTIGSKIFTYKRSFVMRMTSLSGTNVYMSIGDIASSSTSNRLAIQTLAGFVSQGLG